MFNQMAIMALILVAVPSVVVAGDINNKLILEKLNSLSRRVDDKFSSLEKQIDLLRDDMNRRFEDQQVLNYFVFGSILTVLTLVSALIVLINETGDHFYIKFMRKLTN